MAVRGNRADLDELLSTGAMTRAQELSLATGRHLNHNEYPHFFFGDLDAEFVLVHLNPKEGDNLAPRVSGPMRVTTAEEYFDAHRYFGRRSYGKNSPRTHRSVFDHKHIQFVREFEVIDFIDERRPEDRFTN